MKSLITKPGRFNFLKRIVPRSRPIHAYAEGRKTVLNTLLLLKLTWYMVVLTFLGSFVYLSFLFYKQDEE